MTTETIYWCLSIWLWLFLTGIGIPPCPEEAGILYAAGVAALHPEVPWWLAWPAASAGIVCADAMLYGIGRLWGRRLFEYRWVDRLIPATRRDLIEARFHEHGLKLLMLARLLPPVRTGVFLIAGAISYSLVQFLIADLVYAIFGVGLLFFGGTWLIGLVHQFGRWLAVAAVGLLAIYALYRYFRFLRQRELRGVPQPPVSVLELTPVNGLAAPDSAHPAVERSNHG